MQSHQKIIDAVSERQNTKQQINSCKKISSYISFSHRFFFHFAQFTQEQKVGCRKDQILSCKYKKLSPKCKYITTVKTVETQTCVYDFT